MLAAVSDATFVMECGVKSGTMHTVDAAGKYKRPIACYYTEDRTKGLYEGNEKIVREKIGVPVTDTDELETLLNNLG